MSRLSTFKRTPQDVVGRNDTIKIVKNRVKIVKKQEYLNLCFDLS
jgi:hypothetical protein